MKYIFNIVCLIMMTNATFAQKNFLNKQLSFERVHAAYKKNGTEC